MAHKFGNIDSWTKDKLTKVEDYLNAYLTALKKQHFKLEYIDAFAGSGYVNTKIEMHAPSLFDNDETIKFRDFIDGSARVALQTDPPFDKYIFIEKHRKRCEELEKLKLDFSDRADSINIIRGEANIHVQRLCEQDWIGQGRRGVMFLDPYGTQVTWETITAIANTRAIDLWVLFPIGTVNRLLNRNAQIIEKRKERLNQLFGENKWFDILYEISERNSLFPSEASKHIVKDSDPFGVISKYFIERLETIFTKVAPNPLVMKNSRNSPIFLLCFAAGNPNGAPIAVRIAQQILSKS